jgi:hypothetical protein
MRAFAFVVRAGGPRRIHTDSRRSRLSRDDSARSSLAKRSARASR